MKQNSLVLKLMLIAIRAQASEHTGNVNFFLGQKSLDSEDWSPVEDQEEWFMVLNNDCAYFTENRSHLAEHLRK